MKKISLILAFTAMFSGSVLAGELIGAPTSIKKSQFVGDLEAVKHKLDTKRLLPWGDGYAVFDIDSTDYNAKLSYGVLDNVAISLIVGLSKTQIDQYNQYNELRISTDNKSNEKLGLGISFKSYDDGKWSFGGAASWTTFDHELTGYNLQSGGTYGTLSTEIDRIKVSAGAGYSIDKQIKVYGGPVLQKISGNTHWVRDNGDNGYARLALQQDSKIGGYLGAEYQFAPNMTIKSEAQTFGSESTLIGASFSYSF